MCSWHRCLTQFLFEIELVEFCISFYTRWNLFNLFDKVANEDWNNGIREVAMRSQIVTSRCVLIFENKLNISCVQRRERCMMFFDFLQLLQIYKMFMYFLLLILFLFAELNMVIIILKNFTRHYFYFILTLSLSKFSKL